MGNNLPPELRDKIFRRLQRLEGQVRGVCRMIDEDRDCQDVLTQLAAIRGATQQVSLLLVENYALHCVHGAVEDHDSMDETITQLVHTLGKLS